MLKCAIYHKIRSINEVAIYTLKVAAYCQYKTLWPLTLYLKEYLSDILSSYF